MVILPGLLYWRDLLHQREMEVSARQQQIWRQATWVADGTHCSEFSADQTGKETAKTG